MAVFIWKSGLPFGLQVLSYGESTFQWLLHRCLSILKQDRMGITYFIFKNSRKKKKTCNSRSQSAGECDPVICSNSVTLNDCGWPLVVIIHTQIGNQCELERHIDRVHREQSTLFIACHCCPLRCFEWANHQCFLTNLFYKSQITVIDFIAGLKD